MKNIIKRIMELSTPKKYQISIALVLSIALVVTIPVYAWFTNQKKAAEMYKVEYPNALYINAAHREDRIFFGLDGINVNEYQTDSNGDIVKDANDQPVKITNKRYIFSVSGANTNSFTLQMAHTNNNLFTYTVYAATQYTSNEASSTAGGQSAVIIPYTQHKNSHNENTIQVIGDTYVDSADTDLYYLKGDSVQGEYKNNKDDYSASKKAVNSTDNKYYSRTYGSNTNVQDHSVPSYWQGDVSVTMDANKNFCSYFILEVTWDDTQQSAQTSKETDLIYFSVKRKS